MALSSKDHNHPRAGLIPERSFASVVKATIKVNKLSLIHDDIYSEVNSSPSSSDKDPDGQPKVIKTRIWRHSRSPKGLLLDISKLNLKTDHEFLTALHHQYDTSNFTGLKFVGKGPNRYIEIYPQQSIYTQILEQGVHCQSINTTIIPCKALEGNGKVLQMNLSDLPILPKEEVLHLLEPALSKFGMVIDIGLHYESAMGWFMGTGYAIIQQDPELEYPLIHHTIPIDETEFCRATFPAMPTWCRFCHEDGHTKYNCKKAQASILCFSCDLYGHKRADCPNPKNTNSMHSPKKHKQRKISTANNIPPPAHIETIQNPPLSAPAPLAEAHKSKWAPTPPSFETINEESESDGSDYIPSNISEEDSLSDDHMSGISEELYPSGIIDDVDTPMLHDRPISGTLSPQITSNSLPVQKSNRSSSTAGRKNRSRSAPNNRHVP